MCRPVSKMIQWRVIIGAVISPVIGAGGPVEPEVDLDHAAEKIVEPNIDGIGALWDNVDIGESHGGLDGRPNLGTFNSNESLA